MVSVFVPLLLLLSAPQADIEVGQGPEPSPNPIAWELKFTFLDPQRIEVQLPGCEQPEVYWYMVYTVTNTSSRSQRFFPTFQIVTEDLQVFDTDMGINLLVFDAIRQRHKLTHKYLVAPTKAIGALLTGDDNARESVAIWRQIDLSLNSFSVYVGGLSGETQLLRNPVHDPNRLKITSVIGPDGRQLVQRCLNPRYFTLRKTLAIRYTLPGSPGERPATVPERHAVGWLMR